MHKAKIRWLYQELPKLVEEGVVTEETAASLREHYGPPEEGGAVRLIMLFVAILGAALIGLGIILLFAHNWEDLSRPVRTVLSFTPLVLGQALVAYALVARRASRAWCESSGMFLTLGIGACIALIGQTYHIPGDLKNFLFVWVLLALPLIYLLDASAVAALYLVGITAWAGYAQDYGGHALLFWPLLAAALPHVYLCIRRGGARAGFLSWVLCLCLCVATGIVLEKALPGLWMPVYSALFGLMYIYGRRNRDESPAFKVVGTVGTVVLALILTYDWAWNRVGYGYYRNTGRFHEWAALQDYFLALGLYAGALVLSLRPIRERDYHCIAWLCFPVVTLGAYTAAQFEVAEGVMMAAFNVYLLALGVLTLVEGVRRGSLGRSNLGMAILSVLLIARFFDAGLGFTLRGILFIVLGAAFLSANLLLGRKIRRKEAVS